MKLSVYTVLLGAAMTTQAAAQSSIDALCGAGHANEAAAFGAVSPNPDGYYLPGLNIQLSHGDPRIVRAVGSDFHLCTRPASTPEMSAAQAGAYADRRVVKYLFVPNILPEVSPNS